MTGNIVGVFILGVLAGWLVEWLFITFIMAKPKPQAMPMAADSNDHSDAHDNDVLLATKTTMNMEVDEVEKESPAQPETAKTTNEINVKNIDVNEVGVSDIVVKEEQSTQYDDFMRLKGIGPKLAASIKETEINRYDELAVFTGKELIAKLEASGAIIVNRPAFSHIPKQAALAAKGDWEGLETLKKSI